MAQANVTQKVIVEEVKFNEEDKKRMLPKFFKDGKQVKSLSDSDKEAARAEGMLRVDNPVYRTVKGERAFGESFHATTDAEGNTTFWNIIPIKFSDTLENTRVEEGSLIITYPDGTQKVMTKDEAKAEGITVTKSDTPKASSNTADVFPEKSDATLAERAAANGNTLNAQSNAEALLDNDIRSNHAARIFAQGVQSAASKAAAKTPAAKKSAPKKKAKSKSRSKNVTAETQAGEEAK